jgi:hypothetical protein
MAVGGPPPDVMKKMKEEMAAKNAPREPEPVTGKYVRISPKYSRPETSGLKTTVQPGQQEYNIDLK